MMMPARYTGRPFHEVFFDGKPSLLDASLALAERFGFAAWISSGLGGSPDDPPVERRLLARSQAVVEAETIIHTKRGDLTERRRYPAQQAPWLIEPLVTDPWRDGDRLLSTLTDPWTKSTDDFVTATGRVGEAGVVFVRIEVPLAWWLYARGDLQAGLLDFLDEPELMGRLTAAYGEWALQLVRATCERLGPELLMFGGSVSSMSVVSPDLYRRFAFDWLCEAVDIARAHDVPTSVHMCGKCRDALDMLVDSGLDMIEPLERPPGGDVQLAEVRAKYGDRLCLKGNVNTFETLVRGTPEQIHEEARRCIRDGAGPDGSWPFILSSGDQVGLNTPEENFRALIRAAST